MEEMVSAFLVESHENLDQLDQDLVVLEQDPTNRETLDSIFRNIHTIKGTCGFFSFPKLESLTHVGENLLVKLREGGLELNPDITNALLALCDAVREMLSSIEAIGNEGENDFSELLNTLTLLSKGEDKPSASQAKKKKKTKAQKGRKSSTRPKSSKASSSPSAAATKKKPNERKTEPRDASQSTQPVEEETCAPSVADSTIRVDVGLLDQLMNLVGELVLTRNQILQFSTADMDTTFVGTSQRLNLITTELQEGVMRTRMQPIGNLFGTLPRVVRDMAVANNKQVRIEMEGKDTELDKTIIEAIKDPITHLVRNAVDHGIEPPEDRSAKGKPAEGRLFLSAFHEGGQVNIEVSDDGAGMDAERIKEKALERGLISPDAATRMSNRELVNIIFMPGFSTAEKVTNVSGRGVGMDVVRTNIEKIGGTIDIMTELGQGTTYKIKIPLTLAIIPALIINSGGAHYAIPQVSLLELVRLEGEQSQAGIERMHGAPVYRLRGKLLPLVYLNSELKLEGLAWASAPTQKEVVNIVVLKADDRQFGLVVDGINETEEIVVKPLSKQLKGISAFAGATIMGDGRVALILDVLGLAQSASVVSEVRDRALVDAEALVQERLDDSQRMLLFTVGDDRRMAIPLSMVTRLEKFPRSALERAGDQQVVQYRGHMLPIISLSNIFNGNVQAPSDEDEMIQVVVYSTNGYEVGLVVERILDVVEEKITVESCSKGNGIIGSAVIQGRVTDLLDVDNIVNGGDHFSLSAEQPRLTEAEV